MRIVLREIDLLLKIYWWIPCGWRR